jgi:hypothetical protein
MRHSSCMLCIAGPSIDLKFHRSEVFSECFLIFGHTSRIKHTFLA